MYELSLRGAIYWRRSISSSSQLKCNVWTFSPWCNILTPQHIFFISTKVLCMNFINWQTLNCAGNVLGMFIYQSMLCLKCFNFQTCACLVLALLFLKCLVVKLYCYFILECIIKVYKKIFHCFISPSSNKEIINQQIN